jgi:hypothetical protein
MPVSLEQCDRQVHGGLLGCTGIAPPPHPLRDIQHVALGQCASHDEFAVGGRAHPVTLLIEKRLLDSRGKNEPFLFTFNLKDEEIVSVVVVLISLLPRL